jgi:hypothetical protein
MEKNEGQVDKKFAMLLGVGFDGKDGHYRRTRGDNFILVGGSDDTHKVMQDKAVSLNEELDRRGRRLQDIDDVEELRDIAHDAGL